MRPLPTEDIPVADCSGRVLASPALAAVDLPPFASSAMDGFAVRAADTPGELPVAFRIATGIASELDLPVGTVAAISTGGAVPRGADTVVPVEDVQDRGDTVVVPSAEPGRHVRPLGGDVREGDVVLNPGTLLRPSHVGALSAAGIASVRCSVHPRVAVVATGTELRSPGNTLAPGQIYESNRAMIAAVLARGGGDVEMFPVVEDDHAAHRAALERGLQADVLVSSGGVSMGTHDLVRLVGRELGVHEVFWGVAVKPGKPLSFGVRDGTLVFGLPGNPVSTLVGSLVFVSPALRALQGATDPGPHYLPGVAAKPLRRNPNRDEFVRARTTVGDGGVELDPITGQESHMIVRAASAEALVHVPRGDGEIPHGSPVRYLSLD